MKLKRIILTALLLAATIIMNRFLAINTSILSISFTFVPLMLSGIILGYKRSMLIATLADIIGSLLFPFGAYFIGFTISACLTGLIYGLLLYSNDKFVVNKKFLIRLIIAILLVTVLINGLLNTFFIILTVKSASIAIVPVRILKQLIMIPIMFLSMYSITKVLSKEINVIKND